jgi:predicted HTH transcriptional regulator
MMAVSGATHRLTDLLIDPREAPEIEIKGWLDLIKKEEHKASLAKALLALANHGGGFVLIGVRESDADIAGAPVRPATLAAYTQDQINGIVHSYADPPFHCAVYLVPGRDGAVYPIISVPGGQRVPVRARRDGPGKTIVQQHAVYIRRPGPKSETPQSAREWDELFARCLAARRDELLDRVRDLLSGAASAPPEITQAEVLDRWIASCTGRWRQLTEPLGQDDPSSCPHGH